VLTRVLLVVSALAMLATSAPERFRHSSTKGVNGPRVTLTQDAPQATYLVTVRADPADVPPQLDPAVVSGKMAEKSPSDAPFVGVSLRDSEALQGDADLTFATSFTLSRPVTFGDCSSAETCTASFVVDFVRTDGGDQGGTLSVDWSVSFSVSHQSEEEPRGGPAELPWIVEITQQ
jgi:hypothetical protein